MENAKPGFIQVSTGDGYEWVDPTVYFKTKCQCGNCQMHPIEAHIREIENLLTELRKEFKEYQFQRYNKQ